MLKQVVRAEKLSDIAAIEKDLNGKFLQAETLPSGLVLVTLLPAASLEFFINIWNCQAELYLRGYGGGCTPAKKLLDIDNDLLEKLINRVVYDDNDGAINFKVNRLSGSYYPQSNESLVLFRQLMNTAKSKQSV